MNRREMMKAAGAATVLSALPVWAFAAAQEDPYKWVLSMSNQVLDRIKSEPALRNGDIPAIKKLVDELIMPNVDFTMVTRLTVGPKWRQAKPEQRQQLQDNFRELLIRVYSGALSKVKDHVCELAPVRNQKVQDEMVIRSQLKSASAPAIAMDYRIYRNKADRKSVV